MTKICGIYAIGTPSGKIYIGSSVDIVKRWRDHLAELRRGAHRNRRLQNAFNKYGEGHLTFSVMCECSKDDILMQEQMYIDALPYALRLNLALTAGAPRTGVSPSAETRAKIGAAHKGQVRSAIARANMRAVKPVGTTGYRSVFRSGPKWAAYFYVARKKRYIGSYATPELAYAMRLVYLAALPPGGV